MHNTRVHYSIYFTYLLDVNECNSNPCRNGGTCVDLINGYVCRCRNGYTGVNCERRTSFCFEKWRRILPACNVLLRVTATE